MEIEIPCNYRAHETPWHLDVLNSDAQFRVLVCHRRARKTTLACAELVRQKFKTSSNVLYLAPYREQARKLIWEAPNMLQNFVPPDVWAKRNNSEMKLPTPNGGYLYVSGSDNYEAFRGMELSFVVFDEWDDQDPKLWNEVFLPILGVNGGRAIFIGTLKGHADLHAKLNYAMTSDDPNWFGMNLKASESGIVPESVLEEIRKTMPRSTYMQEFENVALADGTAVFKDPGRLVKEPSMELDRGHQFRLGIDLAKRVDWTVISAIDMCAEKPTLLPQRRFNGIDWSMQKGLIEAEWYRHNMAQGFIDSTGVGDPIAEDIEKSCPGIEGFKFTAGSREQLISNLVMIMENDRLVLPPDDGLIAELEAFRWVANRKGADPTDTRVKFRAEVPSGMTDDRVMSLALACWQMPDYRLPQYNAPEEASEAVDPRSPFAM